jgi:cytochrome c556
LNRLHIQKRPLVLITLLLLNLVTACGLKGEDAEQKTAFIPSATLQEIMLHVIDPNVDAIWNAVTTIADKNGVVEIRPQTDADWSKLKGHAVTLQEAANLLMIPGRPVAVKGAATSIHPVELSPEAITQKIDAERQQFDQSAQALHRAAAEVIAAIAAKDVDALEKAGGHVEHACEQCHAKFWYPNDSVPKAEHTLGLKSALNAASKPANDVYLLLRQPS